ncbi:MAG: hypothetical protein LBL94_03035 [Prevotellaceae bacterium]|jgi:hypothetical protein|nr:hypothetical protein [Prevotellaceae bacterium]
MKATSKQIFDYIDGINPSVSVVSSIGHFVSDLNQSIAYDVRDECSANVPNDSLAYKILNSDEVLRGKVNRFTDKQRWVIAFELEKNDAYSNKVGDWYEMRRKKAQAKKDMQEYKLAKNKAASQPVLDFVKSSGKNLKDYYEFLKKNRRYASEFYSKNFSMSSANEFLESK